MPFGGIGIWEVVLILVLLLLVFGPRRLPELGGALGKGIREFKRSVSDLRSEFDSTEPEPSPKEIHSKSSAQTVPTDPRPTTEGEGVKIQETTPEAKA